MVVGAGVPRGSRMRLADARQVVPCQRGPANSPLGVVSPWPPVGSRGAHLLARESRVDTAFRASQLELYERNRARGRRAARECRLLRHHRLVAAGGVRLPTYACAICPPGA